MRTAGRPFFNVVRCHTVGCTGRLHPADVRRQPIDTIVVFRPSELFSPLAPCFKTNPVVVDNSDWL